MLKLKNLFIWGILSILTLGLASCSDDDDKIPNELIGTWQLVSASEWEKENGKIIYEDTYNHNNEKVTFYDDGSYQSWDKNGYSDWELSTTGTWKYKKGKLYITDDSGDEWDGTQTASVKNLSSSQLIMEFYEKYTESGTLYEYCETYEYQKIGE